MDNDYPDWDSSLASRKITNSSEETPDTASPDTLRRKELRIGGVAASRRTTGAAVAVAC
jgi:hypothetical protein